jgi:hypothetical protein
VSGRGAVLVAAGLVLASCGSPYPGSTLSQQVQSWARSTGWSGSLSTLRADARRIAVVDARHDLAAVRTDCDVLVNDALGANQNLPTPDGMLTRILSAAYSAAAAAGRQCVTGAGANEGLSARATGELATAASGYVKAAARLDDLGASVPGVSS